MSRISLGYTALKVTFLRDSKEPKCSNGHRMQDLTLLEALNALAESKYPFDKALRIPYVTTSLPSLSFEESK